MCGLHNGVRPTWSVRRRSHRHGAHGPGVGLRDAEHAGAGIVADSDPEYEQRECEAKAGALMAAAREAEFRQFLGELQMDYVEEVGNVAYDLFLR